MSLGVSSRLQGAWRNDFLRERDREEGRGRERGIEWEVKWCSRENGKTDDRQIRSVKLEGKFREKRRLKEEKQTKNKRRSWQSFLTSKGTSLRRDYISRRETDLLENTRKTTPNSYSGTKQALPTPLRWPLAPEWRNTHSWPAGAYYHI